MTTEQESGVKLMKCSRIQPPHPYHHHAWGIIIITKSFISVGLVILSVFLMVDCVPPHLREAEDEANPCKAMEEDCKREFDKSCSRLSDWLRKKNHEQERGLRRAVKSKKKGYDPEYCKRPQPPTPAAAEGGGLSIPDLTTRKMKTVSLSPQLYLSS
jgi:hypothetical protein